MRLPTRKLEELKHMIIEWQKKKAVTKRKLLSLIGHLSHAAKVVPAGRTFIRRMLDLASKPKKLHHLVRLSQEFHSDLLWWKMFMDEWNGISYASIHIPAQATVEFTSDASGSWGCGAVWAPQWFQHPWNDTWQGIGIAAKELLPIVMAVWGPQWSHQIVKVLCDNMAVVEILKKRTSKDPLIMHLLRSLHFLNARWDIALHAKHIPGKLNYEADCLSRNHLQAFSRWMPNARQLPTPIPPVLVDLLITQRPDWTSPSWSKKLANLFTTGLQTPPAESIPLPRPPIPSFADD